MSGIIGRLREEFSFLRGNFLVLVVTYMLSGLSSGLYYPFESKYYEALGASMIQLGYISAVGSAISAFIRIPGAYATDRFGRRKVIVPFTYLVVLAFALRAVAPGWTFILLATIVGSLAQIYQPALEAIDADSIPKEKRGVGYSIIAMAPGVASSITPIVAGYVVARYDILPGGRYLFAASSAIILCIALLRTLFLTETLEVEPAELSLSGYVRDAFSSFGEVLKETSRELRGFMLMEFLYSFIGPVFNVYLSLLILNVIMVGEVQWGFINSLFLPVSLLLSLPVGKLVDSVSRKYSVMLGVILFIPVGFILALADGYNDVLLGVGLMMVSQVVSYTSVHALRADIIPEESRGRVMGLIGVMKHLVAIPGAILFGWMTQNISPLTPFLVASGVQVAILLMVILYFKK